MIDKNICISCGTCIAICPVGAISFDKSGKAVIDRSKCIRCGACQASCPVEAINLNKNSEKGAEPGKDEKKKKGCK